MVLTDEGRIVLDRLQHIKLLSGSDLLKKLCETSGQYGMLLAWVEEDNPDELAKACPFLRDAMLLTHTQAIALFDSEAEMEMAYSLVVGDDGPTVLNTYSGSCRVYALTCNHKGEFQNENT